MKRTHILAILVAVAVVALPINPTAPTDRFAASDPTCAA